MYSFNSLYWQTFMLVRFWYCQLSNTCIVKSSISENAPTINRLPDGLKSQSFNGIFLLFYQKVLSIKEKKNHYTIDLWLWYKCQSSIFFFFCLNFIDGKSCIKHAIRRKQYLLLEKFICEQNADPRHVSLSIGDTPIHAALEIDMKIDKGKSIVQKGNVSCIDQLCIFKMFNVSLNVILLANIRGQRIKLGNSVRTNDDIDSPV